MIDLVGNASEEKLLIMRDGKAKSGKNALTARKENIVHERETENAVYHD